MRLKNEGMDEPTCGILLTGLEGVRILVASAVREWLCRMTPGQERMVLAAFEAGLSHGARRPSRALYLVRSARISMRLAGAAALLREEVSRVH